MAIKQFKKVAYPAKLLILLAIQDFLKRCEVNEGMDTGDALLLLDLIMEILNNDGACNDK